MTDCQTRAVFGVQSGSSSCISERARSDRWLPRSANRSRDGHSGPKTAASSEVTYRGAARTASATRQPDRETEANKLMKHESATHCRANICQKREGILNCRIHGKRKLSCVAVSVVAA